MRCKNCGSENEENLYICQNCGSPLYEEENNEQITEEDMGATRVVPAVNTPSSLQGPIPPNKNDKDNKDDENKKRQTTIIIAVLAIVLAVVIGVLAGVLIHSSKTDNSTSDASSTSMEASSELLTTKPTTEASTTEKESTTESTTTTTTKPETTTEKIKEYMVEVSCSTGGTVIGTGKYKANEECIAVATPDSGFEFDGWYINGKRVSSKPSYTFSVKSDTSLEAVFTQLADEGE